MERGLGMTADPGTPLEPAPGAKGLCALDPRVRVVSALVLSVVLACLSTIEGALAGLAAGFGLSLFGGPEFAQCKRRLWAVNVFVLFLWLTVPWSLPGETLFRAGPLAISKEGVTLALLVTLKCNAIALVFLGLLGRISLPVLGDALQSLRFPNRLTLLLLFTWRYVHVLESEWRTLVTAARLRGFVPTTSLRTYTTCAFLLGMLFVRALDRSQRVWEAMCLRGFDGRLHCLASFRMRGPDRAFLAALVPLTACLLALDHVF